MAEQQRGAVIAATGAAAVIIAAQVGSKATRDALFLDVFGAAELPKVMLASALLSALGVLLTARGLARFGPARSVPVMFVISAGGHLLEWALIGEHPKAMAALVYLHVAVLGSLLISGFWSVVSERFDPHTAKKVIARITVGATAGGLIGGLTAERVAAWLDARSMLVVLAGMSITAAVAVARAGRGAPRVLAAAHNSGDGGLSYLRQTPYLKLLAGLVALTAVASGMLDYAFKAEASASHVSRESLMSFFAIFYTATAFVTLIAQAALSRRSLSKIGIGGTIALLPGTVLLGGAVGAGLTRLYTLVVVRGAESVLSNSLYRSGYELLFTPLAPERKRPTKTVIDVGFDRAGGAIASGLIMLVLLVAPDHATRLSLIAAALASGVALIVALRLHGGYVAELAASLRSGRVKLDEAEIFDATTRRTLSDTTMAIDREQLLAQIEVLRSEHDSEESVVASSDTSSQPPISTDEPETSSPDVDEVVALLEELGSGDVARMRRALKPPIDLRLTPHVIPLLGHPRLGRTARRALRQVGPKIVGQLVDSMLDEEQSERVRRRLPDIIRLVDNHRAAAGLFAGLDANVRLVRERCASALHEMVRADRTLTPSAAQVFAAARRDIARGDSELRDVFAILGLTLDWEALGLALSALRSDDITLRGTSFEYLENVLPDDVRVALWPRLKEYARSAPPKRDSTRPPRSHTELVAELSRSADGLKIDITSLEPDSNDAQLDREREA